MYQPKLDKDIRCPLDYVQDICSGRWKSRLLCLMGEDCCSFRYTELREGMINISDAALANALQELIHDGMVERTQYNDIPPRVEYTLSDKGKSFIPILQEICKWGYAYYNPDHENYMVHCLNCEHNPDAEANVYTAQTGK